MLDPAALAQAQAKARAQARKLQQLKLQAHATAGAAARFYPAPEGREEVPLLSSEERDFFFRFYPKYSGQYPVRKGGDTAAPVMELCNIVQGDTKTVSVIVLYGIDIAYLLKVVKILNYSQV